MVRKLEFVIADLKGVDNLGRLGSRWRRGNGKPQRIYKIQFISNIHISKGAGPDDIHSQMVRWLADFLAEPLSKLFAKIPNDGGGAY